MPAWLTQEDGVTTSVNGKSRAWDNITIEHLWRTLKTEEVYLKETGASRPLVLHSSIRLSLGNEALSRHTFCKIPLSALRAVRKHSAPDASGIYGPR